MVSDKPYIELKNRKDRDRFYNGMTEEQKDAFSSITNNIFTFIEAAADKGYRPTVNATPVVELSGIKGCRNINVYDTIEQVMRVSE